MRPYKTLYVHECLESWAVQYSASFLYISGNFCLAENIPTENFLTLEQPLIVGYRFRLATVSLSQNNFKYLSSCRDVF